MAEQTAESGLELVLDNRKLIIAFLLLVAVCGCFFVLGFIEGKRQGLQEGSLASAEGSPKADSGRAEVPAAPGSVLLDEGSGEQQRSMFESESRREESIEPALQTGVPASRQNTVTPVAPPKPAPKPDRGMDSIPSARTTYSVQVGAFSQRGQAEKVDQVLRSKGYDCRIEPPGPAHQLYLLKVGKFNSRADAVAVQLRLKKDGFASFIKTD